MKLILELSVDNAADQQDAVEYAKALKARIEQRIWQNLPGVLMEFGDGSIFVKGVVLDASE